jgi:Putative Actinobacterial Holin-X, holin superfamily III
MPDRPDDRSLGDLFAQLSRDTAQLVRKEMELATTEMTAKAKRAGIQAGVAAAGGALAHAGLLMFLAALVLGLSQIGVTPWLSALIVSFVTIGVGYMLVNRGTAGLRTTDITPTRAIETMKEDSRWTTGQRA